MVRAVKQTGKADTFTNTGTFLGAEMMKKKIKIKINNKIFRTHLLCSTFLPQKFQTHFPFFDVKRFNPTKSTFPKSLWFFQRPSADGKSFKAL